MMGQPPGTDPPDAAGRDADALQVGACVSFQAEDGIRDVAVTGVQTCALPIFKNGVFGRDSILKVSAGFATDLSSPAAELKGRQQNDSGGKMPVVRRVTLWRVPGAGQHEEDASSMPKAPR